MKKLNLNIDIPFLSGVTLAEKALLARQLATMLSSGLAVDQAFRILARQTKNKTLHNANTAIIGDLEQGNPLSVAIAKHPKIFDPIFVAIVRSGESTGKLDIFLSQLADRMEQNQDFNSKIKAALYYPVFVVVMMVAIVILMMVFIIPQLKTVFDENDIELPITTRMIIGLSNFTVHFWWLELIIIIVLGVFGYYYFRTQKGGTLWDSLKLKIPIMKDLFKLIYMSRFTRTMSMLIQSGLSIMETIAITADVVQNRIYTRSLKDVSFQVERGTPVSVQLAKDPNFPPIVSEMMSVGEQTGKTGMILDKLAGYYEKETDSKIKALSGLIEPVIIIIVGVAVGFLVISIIWPIYSIAQTGF